MYYHNELITQKNNCKRLWQIINKISGKQTNKSSIIEMLTIDGIKKCEARMITEEVAKQFATVGSRYSNKIGALQNDINYNLNKIPFLKKSLLLYPTTELKVDLLIKNLPSKNSSGYDKVSIIIIIIIIIIIFIQISLCIHRLPCLC